MNQSPEIWSLPWHTLQRNLAGGAGAVAFGTAVSARKAGYLRSVAVRANSWLSRAQSRAAA
jgi:tripartite-type tricarboxylate transporter receptor subunit TctC